MGHQKIIQYTKSITHTVKPFRVKTLSELRFNDKEIVPNKQYTATLVTENFIKYLDGSEKEYTVFTVKVGMDKNRTIGEGWFEYVNWLEHVISSKTID